MLKNFIPSAINMKVKKRKIIRNDILINVQLSENCFIRIKFNTLSLDDRHHYRVWIINVK